MSTLMRILEKENGDIGDIMEDAVISWSAYETQLRHLKRTFESLISDLEEIEGNKDIGKGQVQNKLADCEHLLFRINKLKRVHTELPHLPSRVDEVTDHFKTSSVVGHPTHTVLANTREFYDTLYAKELHNNEAIEPLINPSGVPSLFCHKKHMALEQIWEVIKCRAVALLNEHSSNKSSSLSYEEGEAGCLCCNEALYLRVWRMHLVNAEWLLTLGFERVRRREEQIKEVQQDILRSIRNNDWSSLQRIVAPYMSPGKMLMNSDKNHEFESSLKKKSSPQDSVVQKPYEVEKFSPSYHVHNFTPDRTTGEVENWEAASPETKNQEIVSPEVDKQDADSLEARNQETVSPEATNQEGVCSEVKPTETVSLVARNQEAGSLEATNQKEVCSEGKPTETVSLVARNQEAVSLEATNQEEVCSEGKPTETVSLVARNQEAVSLEATNQEELCSEGKPTKTVSLVARNQEAVSLEATNQEGVCPEVKPTEIGSLVARNQEAVSLEATNQEGVCPEVKPTEIGSLVARNQEAVSLEATNQEEVCSEGKPTETVSLVARNQEAVSLEATNQEGVCPEVKPTETGSLVARNQGAVSLEATNQEGVCPEVKPTEIGSLVARNQEAVSLEATNQEGVCPEVKPTETRSLVARNQEAVSLEATNQEEVCSEGKPTKTVSLVARNQEAVSLEATNQEGVCPEVKPTEIGSLVARNQETVSLEETNQEGVCPEVKLTETVSLVARNQGAVSLEATNQEGVCPEVKPTETGSLVARNQEAVSLEATNQEGVCPEVKLTETVSLVARNQETVSLEATNQEGVCPEVKPTETVSLVARNQEAVSLEEKLTETVSLEARKQEGVCPELEIQEIVSLEVRNQEGVCPEVKPTETVSLVARNQEAVSLEARNQEGVSPEVPSRGNKERTLFSVQRNCLLFSTNHQAILSENFSSLDGQCKPVILRRGFKNMLRPYKLKTPLRSSHSPLWCQPSRGVFRCRYTCRHGVETEEVIRKNKKNGLKNPKGNKTTLPSYPQPCLSSVKCQKRFSRAEAVNICISYGTRTEKPPLPIVRLVISSKFIEDSMTTNLQTSSKCDATLDVPLNVKNSDSLCSVMSWLENYLLSVPKDFKNTLEKRYRETSRKVSRHTTDADTCYLLNSSESLCSHCSSEESRTPHETASESKLYDDDVNPFGQYNESAARVDSDRSYVSCGNVHETGYYGNPWAIESSPSCIPLPSSIAQQRDNGNETMEEMISRLLTAVALLISNKNADTKDGDDETIPSRPAKKREKVICIEYSWLNPNQHVQDQEINPIKINSVVCRENGRKKDFQNTKKICSFISLCLKNPFSFQKLIMAQFFFYCPHNSLGDKMFSADGRRVIFSQHRSAVAVCEDLLNVKPTLLVSVERIPHLVWVVVFYLYQLGEYLKTPVFCSYDGKYDPHQIPTLQRDAVMYEEIIEKILKNLDGGSVKSTQTTNSVTKVFPNLQPCEPYHNLCCFLTFTEGPFPFYGVVCQNIHQPFTGFKRNFYQEINSVLDEVFIESLLNQLRCYKRPCRALKSPSQERYSTDTPLKLVDGMIYSYNPTTSVYTAHGNGSKASEFGSPLEQCPLDSENEDQPWSTQSRHHNKPPHRSTMLCRKGEFAASKSVLSLNPSYVKESGNLSTQLENDMIPTPSDVLSLENQDATNSESKQHIILSGFMSEFHAPWLGTEHQDGANPTQEHKTRNKHKDANGGLEKSRWSSTEQHHLNSMTTYTHGSSNKIQRDKACQTEKMLTVGSYTKNSERTKFNDPFPLIPFLPKQEGGAHPGAKARLRGESDVSTLYKLAVTFPNNTFFSVNDKNKNKDGQPNALQYKLDRPESESFDLSPSTVGYEDLILKHQMMRRNALLGCRQLDYLGLGTLDPVLDGNSIPIKTNKGYCGLQLSNTASHLKLQKDTRCNTNGFIRHRVTEEDTMHKSDSLLDDLEDRKPLQMLPKEWYLQKDVVEFPELREKILIMSELISTDASSVDVLESSSASSSASPLKQLQSCFSQGRSYVADPSATQREKLLVDSNENFSYLPTLDAHVIRSQHIQICSKINPSSSITCVSTEKNGYRSTYGVHGHTRISRTTDEKPVMQCHAETRYESASACLHKAKSQFNIVQDFNTHRYPSAEYRLPSNRRRGDSTRKCKVPSWLSLLFCCDEETIESYIRKYILSSKWIYDLRTLYLIEEVLLGTTTLGRRLKPFFQYAHLAFIFTKYRHGY